MSLKALGCVIKKLFSSVATLFCDTPRDSHAILNCIGYGGCRMRCLAC